jgi:hypothetical protein
MLKRVILASVFFLSVPAFASNDLQSFGITNTRNEDVLINGYDFPFATDSSESNQEACFILKKDYEGNAKINSDSGDVILSKHSYVEFFVKQDCFDTFDHQKLFSINRLDMRALAFLGYIPSNALESQITYKYVNKSAWVMPLKALYGGDFVVLNIHDSGKE